ncbi:hypothetical protein BLA29_006411 [Euroglyphus maynei]|uniref:Uncharacterized protein n=1 Tax=Euroglyphus maynei TaxID=6958 RepID=A0A1Y3B1F5_EURMA|nr:hypothetical protein BLA29_006411 [Euroglyphus maynei]
MATNDKQTTLTCGIVVVVVVSCLGVAVVVSPIPLSGDGKSTVKQPCKVVVLDLYPFTTPFVVDVVPDVCCNDCIEIVPG